MKKLLAIIVLSLYLITPSQADDISDLQIEGMSIGDSLLDYFSKEDIKSFHKIKYKNDKFYEIETKNQKFNDYESMMFGVKKNDKNFTIYSIGGRKFFPNKEKECKIFKKEVTSGIKDIVKNLKVDDYRFYYKNEADGKSYADVSNFSFIDGSAIRLWCVNWSKATEGEKNWVDNMSIAINSKVFYDWSLNEAY
ncbi:hypothetical protein OAB09_04540 [Pelagibacteraceae bacterium]|nr:hypothetical protein [Pelagibacteraceae bacterium]